MEEEQNNIKGKNKGEWSEFYAFLKLLSDGKIYAADQNLQKDINIFYLIIKILRSKNQYVRSNNIIIQNSNNEEIAQIPISTITQYSNLFFNGIIEGKKGKGGFHLEFAKDILDNLHLTKLTDDIKQTSDIRRVIHDPITQFEPLLGFSIKSYMGSKPTLFNASKQSNIIYRITPEIDQETRNELNNFETYSLRILYLVKNNYKLSFHRISSEQFQANLELIDSKLPEILAHLVLHKFLSGTSKLSKLSEYLNQENPCNFNVALNPEFYTYKIKRFLVDAALGMNSSKSWSGQFNATGGFIAVNKDGELLCYHIYNWNDFQHYLLNYTKIDLPDSGKKRCDYGTILEAKDINEKEGSYIKLNFQIRFI